MSSKHPKTLNAASRAAFQYLKKLVYFTISRQGNAPASKQSFLPLDIRTSSNGHL